MSSCGRVIGSIATGWIIASMVLAMLCTLSYCCSTNMPNVKRNSWVSKRSRYSGMMRALRSHQQFSALEDHTQPTRIQIQQPGASSREISSSRFSLYSCIFSQMPADSLYYIIIRTVYLYLATQMIYMGYWPPLVEWLTSTVCCSSSSQTLNGSRRNLLQLALMRITLPT